ncbi:MAG: tetratricopeptide repeat protein [Pseudomonadota bacterium]
MRFAFSLCLVMLPLPALAVGDESASAPAVTETTTLCSGGLIWDVTATSCADPQDDGIDNDARFAAVRELAYAGKAEDALRVLSAMTEGETDRVLTYKGFVLRKAGRLEDSLAAYDAALTQNPDNLLARAYLGMAYVAMNELALASAQLDEIRARNGAGTRAEAALAAAITTGETLTY